MEGHSDLPPAIVAAVEIANEAAQFNHPPYAEMITASILAMKEQDGSSRQAISKYIESEYKSLSPSHATLLTQQLKKMKNQGQLVLNKHSYMFPGSENPQSPVQVSVGTKRRPGRPPKIQSNGGGGGAVYLPASPVSAGVPASVGGPSITVTGSPEFAAPFDPIGAVPTVVPIGQVDGETPFKRRPGRPPKLQAELVAGTEPISVGRRPGRPPKVNNGMVEVGGGTGGSILGKRRRGRPVKKPGMVSALVGNGGGVKKGRGRPPKMRSVGLVMGQRPRGRPRKGTVSWPRGRPRKNVVVNGGGAGFVPVEGMGGAGRPSKMAVRRNPRKLSGKPLGRPKKDASALIQASKQQQLISYQDLKGRVEHFQSRVKQAVDVVKLYLDNEVAPIAVGVLQELEAIALMDMTAPAPEGPITGESAAVTGPSAAPSSDPLAPMSVQGLEPPYLN